MNFVSNLNFAEIMVRYTIMMILGIIAGVTHQYWMIIVVMAVFMEAIMGFCPSKPLFKKETAASTNEHRVKRWATYFYSCLSLSMPESVGLSGTVLDKQENECSITAAK